MEKRKIKLDKVFLIAVIIIIIASLTACGNTENDKEETTTEPVTSSKITTSKAITTTEEETTETTTNKTTTKTTVKATTTKPTTQKATTTTKPKEQTTKKAVVTTTKKITETTKPENQDKEYNKLLEQLNNELSKKSFSEEVNKLFLDTFEALYNNYSSWEKGYKDLPSKAEYINNNLTNVIKNIDKVDFYKRNSEKANKLIEEGLPIAWTEVTEDDKLKITIIAEPSTTEDKEARVEDIENFSHEIIHCKEKSITFNSEYFNGYEELEQLFTEGGATFHMKFIKPSTAEAAGSWLISDENGEINIAYTKDNCQGYLVEMNAYEKLVYLAGYNVIDKAEKGEVPLSALKDTIAEKYGEKQVDEFLQTMKDWYTEYLNSYKGEKIYNLAIDLENQFLDFIKQDIESLKTKEEAKKYKSKYDFYMTKNLPVVTDTQSYQDLTREKFDIETLDKMLEEKLK